MPQTNANPTHKRCQCGGCGEVFSTVGNFDRHRVGKGERRHCADPATVGLVIRQSDRGSWWQKPGLPLLPGQCYPAKRGSKFRSYLLP